MRNFGTAFRNYFNGTAENSIEYSVSVDSLTFTNADIVSMKITGGLYTGYTQSYGGTFSRRLRLQVRTASPSSVPLRATVIPSLRTATPADGAWNSLGTFFIDHREYDVGSGVLTIDAYDAMIKAEAEFVFPDMDRTYADTDIANLIASQLGTTWGGTRYWGGYTGLAPLEGYTCREIIKYLGIIEGGNIYIGADGTLRIRRDGSQTQKTAMNPTITRSSGINSNGTLVTGNAKYARTGLWNAMPTRCGVSMDSTTYEYRVAYYTASGNISTGEGFLYSETDYHTGKTWFPEGAAKFALTFRRKDGANITSANATTIKGLVYGYAFTDNAVTPDNVNITDSSVFDMKDGQNNVAINGKVLLNDTKGTTYEAGSGDGVLELSCPWASQFLANVLAEQLSDVSYVPYSMDALVSPEMEVGDTLTYGGKTFVISDFSQNFTQLFRADVGVPGSSELDHEWTFETSSARSYKRTITNLYAADASLEVREGIIEGKVSGLEGNYASLIVEVGSISLEVASVSSSLDSVSSTVANLTVDVSGITQSVTQLTSTVSGISSSVSTLSVQVGTISAEVTSMSSNKLDKTGGNSQTFGWALTSTAFLLYSNSSTVFKCNSSGIEVNGTITAWDGKIADWDIETNYLGTAGAAADTFFLSQTGKSAWVSQASANKDCIIYSAGNFAVTNGGVLYANNAVVSGDITATSGSFTGTITARAGQFGASTVTYPIMIGTTAHSNSSEATFYTRQNSFAGMGGQWGANQEYSSFYLSSTGFSLLQRTSAGGNATGDRCFSAVPGGFFIQENAGTASVPKWFGIRFTPGAIRFYRATGVSSSFPAFRTMSETDLANYEVAHIVVGDATNQIAGFTIQPV